MEYYELLIVFVDDVLAVSHSPKSIMKDIGLAFYIKYNKYGPSTAYLVSNLEPNRTWIYIMEHIIFPLYFCYRGEILSSFSLLFSSLRKTRFSSFLSTILILITNKKCFIPLKYFFNLLYSYPNAITRLTLDIYKNMVLKYVAHW